ncbi:alpha/beta hydrolase family protein [Bizionia myxarmorum]|uniref:Prolyl oligopeptidase family serine peptidase n=1 Tax=Bizionia myxarmorum TaxID=291186 RepID=A0A5D0R4Q7_9FLAO|nr:alpha/beta fold hydrolase [Bizionia myxarmorum]TYB75866.1 prolyl oligopeptidase family serine peptidase [Bizionia myxarmorum]
MKHIFILLITIFTAFSLSAQDITGQWNGVLKVQGTQLRVVFNVVKTDTGFSATMDSPDQGANGIPVTNTTFENPSIKFEVANAQIEYNGELKEHEIIGTFKQGGYEFPMNLSRKAIEKEVVNRPQEPIKPFPYYSEDVKFQNLKANISLSGTLTLPKKEGIFPVVVLISGSGPQNRDEELLGHKPFLVISDYLTRNGIAVLRYDDRGVAESEGDFGLATSADFATDVESAIAYLKTRKEINKKEIGLIGHSEGGLIAPMIASKSKDVSFIVLLAGTGIQGDKLLLLQQELIAKVSGVSEAEIKETKDLNSELFEIIVQSDHSRKLKTDLSNKINDILTNQPDFELPNGMSKEEFVSMQVNQIATPWMVYFMKFDPATALENVKCPVLAVNGEKDLQVPPKENLSTIKNALTKGGNKNVKTMEFPNLNHLFQECETGSPDEYATIEQTFSPLVLEEITKWIKIQTK